jgi:hypothetical protein
MSKTVPVCEATATDPERPWPEPAAASQFTNVVEIHTDVAQTVEPIKTVGVRSPNPKLLPWMLNVAPPVIGSLYISAKDAVGASYENALSSVPTIAEMVKADAKGAPMPALSSHVTRVAEFQAAVPQSVEPTRTLGEMA